MEEGVQTKKISYVKYDKRYPVTYKSGYVLTWYEPMQDYLRDEYTKTGYSETFVEGDTYTINEYSLKSTSTDEKKDFYLSHLYTLRLNNGGKKTCELRISYNEDGTVFSSWGSKNDYEYGIPTLGYTRNTWYEYKKNESGGEWIPRSRSYYTNGFYENELNEDGFMECVSEVYDSDKGWIIKSKSRYEAEPSNLDGILKQRFIETRYDKDGNEMYTEQNNRYYRVSDNSYYWDVYVYDNGNYVIGSEKFGDYYTFVFYDCQGNELKRLRKVVRKNDANTIPNPGYHLEELKNGVWTRINDPKIEIGENEGKIVYQFGSNGYPVFDETYKYGILYERNEYTYTDNGYTMTKYETNHNGGVYKRVSNSKILSGDNVLISTFYFYDKDGTISSGSKYEDYPNGLRKSYDLNDDGSFTFSLQYVPDNVSTDDDGFTTRISYRYDDAGNVYEKYKNVSRYGVGYDYYETYIKEEDKWVGMQKYEINDVSVPYFEILPVVKPEDGTVDKWQNLVSTLSEKNSKYYVWNNDTEEWMPGDYYLCEYKVDGNTLTYKNKEKRLNKDNVSENEKTVTVKRDDAYRMTEVIIEEIKKCDGNVENSSRRYTYTYNDDGKLTERNEYRNGDIFERYIYTYGDIVVTEVEHISCGATFKMCISGRDITVDTMEAITLYNMSGMIVAHSSDGKIVAPADGVFVMTVGGNTMKIVVNGK